MGQQSTDVDLRALVKELEVKKRQIDKEIEALYIVIRLNQERANGIDAGGRRIGTYAQELTDAIHDTLFSERPLHRNVILERVTERGIHVGGAKPMNSIGSYLSTDQRFKNVGKGVWTLTEKPQAEISLPGSIPDIPSLNIPDLVLAPHIRDYEDVDDVADLPF